MQIKLLGAAFAGALATGLVFAAIGLAATGAAAKPGTPSTITFHLVEVDQSFHFVDNPPLGGTRRPPSQGDTFVFVSNLVTKSGKRAGTLYASCTAVTGGKDSVSQCLGNFALAGGELVASATVRGDNNAPTHIAILGGTKAYAGVRGSVVSVPQGAEGNRSNDTFYLVR